MNELLNSGTLLLTVASEGELNAVLKGLGAGDIEPPPAWQLVTVGSMAILNTGVGKSNAAGAVSRELTLKESSDSEYTGVISIGLGGSFNSKIKLGESVLGLDHILIDEGTISGEGWVTLETSGWTRTVIASTPGQLNEYLKSKVDHVGNIGTVSTISGTNSKMNEYKKRFEVMLEVMESAAIAEVCDKFKIEYADVRVVSNYCGERTDESHDFPGALSHLTVLVRNIFDTFN